MIRKTLLTLAVIAIAGTIILLSMKESPTQKSEAPETPKGKAIESTKKVINPKDVKVTATLLDKEGKPLQLNTVSNTVLTQLSAKDIIDKLRDSLNGKPVKGMANINRSEYIKQLKAIGIKALPEITNILYNSSENVGLKAILLQVLGGIKTEQATDLLVELAITKTMENNIRRNAVDMLTRNAPSKTYDVVKNILDSDPNFPQHYSLIKALGDSKDERAILMLLNIIENDTDKSARYVAISNGLVPFATNPTVREKLKGYATDNSDPTIRRSSIVTLSKQKDDQTKMFFEGILNTEKDPKVINAAKQILSRW